jgi:Protein of unknown function (DUF3703)
MSSFGQRIRPFVQAELDAARHARGLRDADGEFICLERAHVLSQADTRQHVRVHAEMLLWGIHQRSAREVFGQAVRIIGAATKTSWQHRWGQCERVPSHADRPRTAASDRRRRRIDLAAWH